MPVSSKRMYLQFYPPPANPPQLLLVQVLSTSFYYILWALVFFPQLATLEAAVVVRRLLSIFYSRLDALKLEAFGFNVPLEAFTHT